MCNRLIGPSRQKDRRVKRPTDLNEREIHGWRIPLIGEWLIEVSTAAAYLSALFHLWADLSLPAGRQAPCFTLWRSSVR